MIHIRQIIKYEKGISENYEKKPKNQQKRNSFSGKNGGVSLMCRENLMNGTGLVELITTIALYGFVPRGVLLIKGSKKYKRELIQKALSSGYIRAKDICCRTSRTKYTDHYYVVTKNGIRFLSEQTSPIWCRYIDRSLLDEATLYGKTNKGTKQVIKAVQISETRLISSYAGAEYDMLCTDMYRKNMMDSPDMDESKYHEDNRGDSTVKNTYAWIVSKAIRMSDPETEIYKGISELRRTDHVRDDQIRYTDIQRIKQIILPNRVGPSGIRDFDRCIFDGIVESRKRFIMLYTCCDVGKPWNSWNICQDQRIADLWNREYAITEKPVWRIRKDMYSGLLFVRDGNHFAAISKDYAGYLRKNEYLGKGYSEFYIVPKNETGVRHLRFLLLSDFSDMEKKAAELLKTKNYSVNSELRPDLFFMRSENGSMVINGIKMDINKIRQVLNILKDRRYSMNIEILCFAWQKEYYTKIIPEAEITIADEMYDD